MNEKKKKTYLDYLTCKAKELITEAKEIWELNKYDILFPLWFIIVIGLTITTFSLSIFGYRDIANVIMAIEVLVVIVPVIIIFLVGKYNNYKEWKERQ